MQASQVKTGERYLLTMPYGKPVEVYLSAIKHNEEQGRTLYYVQTVGTDRVRVIRSAGRLRSIQVGFKPQP